MTPGIDAQELRDLVARASTLRERLDGVVVPTGGDMATAQRRLDEWRRVVARGDAASFAQRLAFDGADETQALPLLGEVRWADGPLPAWADIVGDATARLADEHGDAALAVEPGAPEGLAVALPFVRVARTRIAAVLGPLWTEARDDVRIADESRLAHAVARQLRHVIDQALRTERSSRYDRLSEAIMVRQPDPPCEFHDAVIDELAHDGFRDLVLTYAVVARGAAECVLDWVDGTAEFHRRLADDTALLARELNGGMALGPLERYGSATSDAHGGGRSVRQCVFADGVTVMYKPKSLAGEVALAHIAALIGRDDERLLLRTPIAIDRGAYGWSEFVRQEPARDAADVARYHFRAGVLLAVLHGLGGSDLHLENLIAAHDQPVMIDSETLLGVAPQLAGRLPEDVRDAEVLGAVIGIGILPQWVEGAQGRTFDISALGARDTQEGVNEALGWEGAGTDAARLEHRFHSVPPQANVLLLADEPVRCEDHVDDVADGFAAGYDRLRAVAGELTAPDGPLALLADVPVRTVIRSTRVYGRAMVAAERIGTLRHGVDRSIQLEIIARPVLDAPEPGSWTEILRCELEAMERRDIPAFNARGGATQLDLVGIDVPVECSAIDRATARLRLLDDEDRELQLRYIRMSLQLRGLDAAAPTTGVTTTPGSPIDGARALARALADDAQRFGDGVMWIAPELGLESQRWNLALAGPAAYAGVSGIALALAAYARIADDPSIGVLVRDAIRPLLEEIERRPSRFPPRYGISLASGCAGMALALAAIGRLLDDPDLPDSARGLLAAVEEEHVTADQQLDLLSGSAGLLHAATVLDDQRVATLAAARLERAAIDVDGAAAWRSIAQAPLTGASHGTTGIAGALVPAGDRFGAPTWTALGERALLLDDARFDAALGSWPDLRDHRRLPDGSFPGVGGGWCHGAAGFALTYASLLDSSIGAAVEPRLRHATGILATAPLPSADHLCCGAAGWAEAARTLLDLPAAADHREALDRGLADWRAAAAGRAIAGALALLGPAGGVASHSVALMTGRSGVLWALLAAEDPTLAPFGGIFAT